MITRVFIHLSYYFSFFYQKSVISIIVLLLLQHNTGIAQVASVNVSMAEQFSSYLLAQNEPSGKTSLLNSETSSAASLQTMQMQYTAGFRNTGFLKAFAQKLKDNNLPYEHVVKNFLDIKRKRNECKNTETLDFVYNFASSVHTQAIDALIEQQALYEKIYGEQVVQNKIKSAVIQGIQLAVNAQNQELFQRCIYICNNANLNDLHAEFALNMTLEYYAGTNNVAEYVAAIQKFLKGYSGSNPELYSRLAWGLCSNTNNLHSLHIAENAILKALALSTQQYDYHEIYANILFKMHRFEDAKKAAKCGIVIAQQSNVEYNYLQKMVNIIDNTQQKNYAKKNKEI